MYDYVTYVCIDLLCLCVCVCVCVHMFYVIQISFFHFYNEFYHLTWPYFAARTKNIVLIRPAL